MVLIHLRKGEMLAGLAAWFGVRAAAAWRYVTEAVGLLATRARSCGQCSGQPRPPDTRW